MSKGLEYPYDVRAELRRQEQQPPAVSATSLDIERKAAQSRRQTCPYCRANHPPEQTSVISDEWQCRCCHKVFMGIEWHHATEVTQ